MVQIAVSVVLLAGAGLLTRTMLRLADVDTGLRTEEVLTVDVPLLTPAAVLGNPKADAGAKARYEQMRSRDRARSLAWSTSAVGSPMPLRGIEVPSRGEGRGQVARCRRGDAAGGASGPRTRTTSAPPAFRCSRAASSQPPTGSARARVVIINQTLADQLFPDEDPIGKRIAWTGDVLRFTPFSGDWRTVVGVVGNTQDGGLDAAPRPVVFMPFAQELALGGGLVIRADSNVAALMAAAATRIVRRIAPPAPIENVMTIAQIKDQSVSPRRLNAVLISSFGMLAVIIAAVGIAGVLAFSVSARTNEIGIRMSLGRRSRPGAADDPSGRRRAGGARPRASAYGRRFFAARIIRGLLFGVAPTRPGHVRRRGRDDGGDRHPRVLDPGAARVARSIPRSPCGRPDTVKP